MKMRSEVIIENWPSISKEIIENTVSPHRNHFSKDPVIIIFSLEFVTKTIICLIDFHELSVGFFIARISLRMVLQSKFSVCFSNLVHSRRFRNPQYFVVVVERIGIVFIEKLFFFLIDQSMFIEEFLESRVGIFKGILLIQQFIIVSPFVPIRKNLVSLSYLLELGLSSFSMFFVFVRMPFGCKFFIGSFDLEERGVFRNPQNGVVVLEFLAHRFA